MSNRLEQNPPRISFDPGHVDVDALDEIAGDQNKSRAELIRETLAEVVEEHDDADGENASLHKPDHSNSVRRSSSSSRPATTRRGRGSSPSTKPVGSSTHRPARKHRSFPGSFGRSPTTASSRS